MEPLFVIPENNIAVTKLPKKAKTVKSCKSCSAPFECKNSKFGVVGEGGKGILIMGPPLTKHQAEYSNQLYGNDLCFLKQKLNAVGLSLEKDCWYINCVSCYTEMCKTASSKKDAVIKMCRSWWAPIIAQLAPRKIVLLGLDAATGFIGDRTETGKIGGLERWVGFSIPDQQYKCWVYPTYAPKDVLLAINPPQGVKVHKVIAAKFEQHLARVATHLDAFLDF